MQPIDLRSDTVTKPSPAMRQAMARAEVGDDVYGEDPTVNQLQDQVAELLGKPAGLLVSSGSMGNLIALFLHAGRGGEVLAHQHSHIFHYELASGAALAGCQIVPIAGERGILTPSALEKHRRGPIYYNARTKLIELENTGNLAGGTCYSQAELQALQSWAQTQALPIHLDGARLWNASIATGLSPQILAGYADTVSVCLSKGLGAPMGSVLVGPSDWIAEARRVRKMLGGGLRQVGSLAAAGLYALEHHLADLATDHHHAKLLAQALQSTSWARVSQPPETNIVFAETPGQDATVVAAQLKDRGLWCSALSRDRLRFVTHRDVSPAQIQQAIGLLKSLD